MLGVYHAWQSAKVAVAAWPGGGGGGGRGGHGRSVMDIRFVIREFSAQNMHKNCHLFGDFLFPSRR